MLGIYLIFAGGFIIGGLIGLIIETPNLFHDPRFVRKDEQ